MSDCDTVLTQILINSLYSPTKLAVINVKLIKKTSVQRTVLIQVGSANIFFPVVSSKLHQKAEYYHAVCT